MIFLPNSFEKYLYQLRIYTSLSIIKYGILPRHLKNLKKIYLAEAFLFKNSMNSTDLCHLSHNLLCCVKSTKKFNFKLDIPCNVSINVPLYTVFLLQLAKQSSFLRIEFKNGIIITGNGKIKNSRKIITHLNGCSFFDTKTLNFLIYIPCVKTHLSPIPTISQWELLFDRFSVFNLFFIN